MLRWGIYGAGKIAGEFAADFPKVKGAKLIAAYARKEDSVKLFCETNEIEHAYHKEDDFFGNPDIDVVYVSTPHALHAEVVKKALKAGKHVLCEKPFALNAKQTKEVFELAAKENRFVMEALWTLFLPTIQKVFSWVEEGRIGELRAVEANFGFVGNQDPEWRLMNPKLGGGALLDVGIYPVLMANALNKSIPLSINAHSHFTQTGVDGSTFITCEYPNGIMASLNASVEMDLVNTLFIYGDQGRIEVPSFWMADEATLITADGTQTFVAAMQEQHGYEYEAQAVCDAIENGESAHKIVSHEFSISLMETLDRIRQEIGLVYDADE
jgi:predicted dehydrogenase